LNWTEHKIEMSQLRSKVESRWSRSKIESDRVRLDRRSSRVEGWIGRIRTSIPA